MTPRAQRLAATVLLVALAIVPYLGSLRGEFVYDDRIQILDNSLIQRPELLARALTHDVWSFKGDRDRAWSNYFRPVFVLWLAANWRLFGAQPLGWHLTNLLLHAGVVLLAFALLRRLGTSLPRAFLAAAIFAVHPVHVESVAWISGSPDLLMAAGILGALLIEARAPGKLRWPAQTLALAAGFFALFTKEAALLLPLLVAALTWSHDPDLAPGDRLRTSLRAMLPYAVLAGAFLLLRQQVIGGFATPTPWRLSPLDLAASLPGVFAFYLRQVFLPLWVGPSYPLRGIAADTIGLTNFALPLAAALGCVALGWFASRRSETRLFFFALALLPLAPALNLGAFIQEQIVHDRYLYLPLLGWIALALEAGGILVPRPLSPRGLRLATALGAVLLLGLAGRTSALVADYRDEPTFFRAAVRSDPTSSYNWAQLASTEFTHGRFAEAAQAADRALRIGPVTTALIVRADLAARERRYAAAESDLKSILRVFPDQTAAIERLAIVLVSQGKRAEAITLLRSSREVAPWRRCTITGNLGVILYLDGQKEAAARELESVRRTDGLDRSPACELVLFRLGSLYLELGRPAEARSALLDYLRASAGSTAAFHREPRLNAERALGTLPPDARGPG